jgi:hypothetical protein
MLFAFIKGSKRWSIVEHWNTLLMIIIFTLTGCSAQEVKPDVANHVVVMVDASGSYKSRQSEAIEKAMVILEGLSKTKLKRWELQSDKIYIVSLDASPDTLWQGSLKDLKDTGPSFWKERFQARTDYASCTDVSGAFRLAARYLEGDSRYVSKYLFVFSDLLHEPPTSNMRTCQSPVKVSPEDFPWASLTDVSVSVFWMPPDQKLLWRRAVQERGLESNFALYATSDSATATIPTPPRPKEKVTDEDRKAQRVKIVGGAKSIFVWFFGIIGAIFLLGVLSLLFQRYRNRSGAQSTRVPIRPMPVQPRLLPGARPVPPNGRPVSGPRPPVVPQRRRPQ